MVRVFLVVSLILFIAVKGSGQCANPPTVTLSKSSGATCRLTPITLSGNTFGGSATRVTITEDGDGSVSQSTVSSSPFSITYTPRNKDIGKTVIITATTNNPLGGSCKASTATYTLTVADNPSAPVVGAINQPTCSLATGSVVLSGLPASGIWTLTRTPGVTTTGSGTSTTISGLATGTYTYTVTNAGGCISVASGNVVINTQPSTPAAPVVGAVTQPVCTVATGSVLLSGLPSSGNWTLTRAPGGVTTTGTGASTTISGLAAGTYNYTVTSAAGCISLSSANVVINTQPPTPVVTLQTSSISSGGTFTVTPGGVPVGTTYTWTAPTYTGGVTGGSAQASPQTNISGTLTIPSGTGTATYTVTPTSGSCVGSTFTVTVTVTSTCVAVTIGTQPADNNMCATSGNASFSVVASGSAPFTYQWQYNNSGTWASVANGTPTGATYTNATTATMSVSGITAAGSPQYRCYITNCSGGNNATSAAATLTVNANPTAPAPGTITQPTCALATGSVVLSGLPSSGTWTLTRSPGGVTTTGSGASTTISGLAVGTCTFTVTNANNCVSGSSANIVITAPLSTPAVPVAGLITPPTCTVSTGSVDLSGLPSSGTWTLTRTPGGVTTTGSGTSMTISNLPEGTYTFTVTNSIGCTSSSSGNVVIPAQPATPSAPVVGTITPPTCVLSTGSAVLIGLPSAGTWTLIRLPGIVTSTGTGTGTTVSGLLAGLYNYTVTNAAGCLSAPSVTIEIPAQPVTPAAPTIGILIQPTCNTGAGSMVLSGLPSGNWTINPGGVTGGTPNTTISGLAPGNYTYTVTNSFGCTSEASSNVVINAQPATPVVIITNPSAVCSPLKVDLTAASVTAGSTPGLTFTYWTNPEATTAYTTPAAAGAGTYYIKGTAASGCSDIKSVTVTINPLPTANAGTGGDACDLNFKFNAVASIGTGTWTKTTGPGTVTFAPNTNTAASTVTVSEYGTYTFTWTEVSGTCSNSSAITVNFYRQPVNTTGTGGNNCGLDFNLKASLDIGTGTWTKVSGPGNATFSPDANSADALVSVTAFGIYNFRWNVVNGTCSSSAIISITFIQQPPADAGTGGDICGKEFVLNAVAATGTGTWSKVSGPGNAIFTPDNHQNNATVTVDQFGTYDFSWTVVNSTCASIDIVSVVFHELPVINAGVDKVICKGNNIQLQAQGTGFVSWVPGIFVSNAEILDPIATPDKTTTFSVTLTDQIGCKNSDDVIVEVREKPVADAGRDQILEYLFETKMDASLVHPDYETGVWSLISGAGEFSDTAYARTSVNGLSLNENKFLWTVSNKVCPVSSDTVRIIVHDLLIPTLITPNMDGRNDYFVLRGLPTLGRTELVIFDSRGVQVYKNLNYDNTWNGVDSKGNPLPDDTYFYVLKGENDKFSKGYIVIRR